MLIKRSKHEFMQVNVTFYFIASSEFNACLKQIKVKLSAVKKYRIISAVDFGCGQYKQPGEGWAPSG